MEKGKALIDYMEQEASESELYVPDYTKEASKLGALDYCVLVLMLVFFFGTPAIVLFNSLKHYFVGA